MKLKKARILITADLDEPEYEADIAGLFSLFAEKGVPLTLFVTDGWREEFPDIVQRLEAAQDIGLEVEIGSHSARHVSMKTAPLSQIVRVIGESISGFKAEGLDVRGFRMPYLSTELRYRQILREASRSDIGLSYDSSLCLEGKFRYSRIYNILPFPWKAPQRIGNIWELPISCMDDYHLYQKYGLSDEAAFSFWAKRLNTNLRLYRYSLFMFHPYVSAKHLEVIGRLIDRAKERYGEARFVTCQELVSELNNQQV